jgi:hypothetical protein
LADTLGNTRREEEAVDIGQPRRIIEVEPVTLPVPETLPEPAQVPEPAPVPGPEPATPDTDRARSPREPFDH